MENVILLDKTSTDDSEEEDRAGWNIILPLGQFFIMRTEENNTTVLNKAGWRKHSWADKSTGLISESAC